MCKGADDGQREFLTAARDAIKAKELAP
jgi:hypothetical protein